LLPVVLPERLIILLYRGHVMVVAGLDTGRPAPRLGARGLTGRQDTGVGREW
jgi:hypothetical protein